MDRWHRSNVLRREEGVAQKGKMSGTQSMASILPSIRCSDCGVDVELSMMGEHVCSKPLDCKIYSLRPGRHANTGPKATPFPQLRNGQVFPKLSPEGASDQPSAFKAARAPAPPRLQMNAIGTRETPTHLLAMTDKVQVGHWSHQMSLHLPAVAAALMPSHK